MLKHDNVIHRVKALSFVRRMRGGSQSSLLECDDGRAYVTKLRYNPQGPNLLANEWIANAMARSIGLPVPECAMVELDERFIKHNPDLEFQLARASYMPPAGAHFGSQFLKPHADTSRLLQHLNSSQQNALKDQQSYMGITLFDLLTESADIRQAVYIKHHNDVNISTTFIDFGHHFRGPFWARQAPHRGPFLHSVGKGPELWAKPRMVKYWLAKFRTTLPNSLSQAISQVPRDWHTGNIQTMEARYLKRIASFNSIVHDFVASSSQTALGSASWPEHEAAL